MLSIRRNVFETNSSSTHSLTMCSENEYDNWKNGKLLYHKWNEKFLTKEQIIEEAKGKRNEYLNRKEKGETIYHYQEEYMNANTDEKLYELETEDGDYYTYDRFWDEMDYVTFEDEYTTSGGEKVIAFGYYGYDG